MLLQMSGTVSVCQTMSVNRPGHEGQALTAWDACSRPQAAKEACTVLDRVSMGRFFDHSIHMELRCSPTLSQSLPPSLFLHLTDSILCYAALRTFILPLVWEGCLY